MRAVARGSKAVWMGVLVVLVGLVLAACGLFASTSHDPVWSFASICFAALGFKAASSLFWPIPQGYLDTRVAAAVIALINSVANGGGIFAPKLVGSFGVGPMAGLMVWGMLMALLTWWFIERRAAAASKA
jgi:hypothetical protein